MASGTETRRRQLKIAARLSASEHEALSAAAERAGLSLAGYARSVLLSAPPLRQSRRPPVERAQLAKLLGEIGKLGSNVNQIARDWNSGKDVQTSEIDTAARAILEMRAVLMEALGRVA